MPCTLQQWEIDFEEERENEETFGKKLTDQALLEEVACQMGRLIYREGLLKEASPLVQKWINIHKKKDSKAKRKWDEPYNNR